MFVRFGDRIEAVAGCDYDSGKFTENVSDGEMHMLAYNICFLCVL